MIITFIIGIIKFNFWKENSIKDTIKEVEVCKSYKNNYNSDLHKKYCENLISSNDENLNLAYFDVMTYVEDFMPLSSNFILIFFVVISSTYYISKYLKNNILSNDLTRQSYKKIKTKLLICSWLPALVIPIISIFKLIVFYVMTKNFDYSASVIMWQESSLSNVGLFFISYILISLFDSLIYSNISLIVIRKKHNFILSSLLSYLVIIGVELFLEIVVNMLICTNIFHSEIGVVFNIINFGCFNDSYGIFIPLVVSIVIFFITLIIVCLIYKNKEKVIIDCEIND
jgi:membrane protein